jgi:hypothetical protein
MAEPGTGSDDGQRPVWIRNSRLDGHRLAGRICQAAKGLGLEIVDQDMVGKKGRDHVRMDFPGDIGWTNRSILLNGPGNGKDSYPYPAIRSCRDDLFEQFRKGCVSRSRQMELVDPFKTAVLDEEPSEPAGGPPYIRGQDVRCWMHVGCLSIRVEEHWLGKTWQIF